MEMPVCAHCIPIKLACRVCNREKEKSTQKVDDFDLKLETKILKRVKKENKELYSKVNGSITHCYKAMEIMHSQIEAFKKTLCFVGTIEARAQEALDLFIRKAHNLKQLDAQRDDVINSLCQKISQLEQQLKKEG